MTHDQRSTRGFQFIAFSMITGNSLARSSTARGAIDSAVEKQRLDDADFIECLDCGGGGRKVWDSEIALSRARGTNVTVFRGAGYRDSWEPIDLAEPE